MTIGEVCFILTLLAKISANYNALRSCILVLLCYDPTNFPKITNIIITVVVLIITTFIASIFQSISDYISLIGSFCTVLISFFIPGLVYIKGNDYPIKHYKNILTLIFISLILILGLTSGFFTIKGINYVVTSNSNGYASLRLSLKPGKYKIYAKYNGYTVSNKITIKPTLTAKNIKVKKGKTIKFKAKLVNTKGKALKNKKILFKFKGKKYKVKTNKKGIATLKLKLKLKPGKYVIKTSFKKLLIKNTIKIKK